MLEKNIRRWEQEYIQQGKAEGIATQKNTLLEMLSDRFGDIPVSWQNAISQINDPVFLSQLIRTVYKAKSEHDYANILLRSVKTQ